VRRVCNELVGPSQQRSAAAPEEKAESKEEPRSSSENTAIASRASFLLSAFACTDSARVSTLDDSKASSDVGDSVNLPQTCRSVPCLFLCGANLFADTPSKHRWVAEFVSPSTMSGLTSGEESSAFATPEVCARFALRSLFRCLLTL
jgi:hypothetical protein